MTDTVNRADLEAKVKEVYRSVALEVSLQDGPRAGRGAGLEEYIADAYTRTAEALQRGVKLTDEGED